MTRLCRHLILVFSVVFLAMLGAGCAPPEQETDPPQTDSTVDSNVPAEPVEESRPSGEPLDRVEVTGSRTRRQNEMAEMVADSRSPHFAPSTVGHSMPAPYPSQQPLDRENYASTESNPVMRVSEHPVSTFSIDVDTGSYSNLRRILREGRLPPENAVRVEEMINYFSYDYPVPEAGGAPFSVTVEQAMTPWNANTRLLQIGLQGYRPDPESIPASNLV